MVPCVCIPMCYHPYVAIEPLLDTPCIDKSLNIIGIPTCHLILNMACQPHVIAHNVVLKVRADKVEWLNKLRNVIHLRSTQLVALELTHLVFVFLDIIVVNLELCSLAANVPKVGLCS
ncbi:hypothetical protein AAG906_007412 [Vitis piasezkii]